MFSVVVAVLSTVDELKVVDGGVVDCTPPGSPSCETVAVSPPPSPTVSRAGVAARTSLPSLRENGMPDRTTQMISPQAMIAIGKPNTHHGRADLTATGVPVATEERVGGGA